MADKIERVLVVTAHPDDSEFGAGGTIAKLAKDGCEITYVIVTNGNKGSGDRTMTPERLAAIRADEQRNAARTLGVARVEFLGLSRRRGRGHARGPPRRHPRDPAVAARPAHLPEPGPHLQPGRLAPRPPHGGRRRARLRLSARARSHGVSRAVAGVRAAQGAAGLRDAVAEPAARRSTSPTSSTSSSARWPATPASSPTSRPSRSACASARARSASRRATRTRRASTTSCMP